LNLGEQLVGKLMIIDALDLSFRNVTINKDKSCTICNK
jgi:adenylyltransferase/sulfurtransferase